jgi:hypothetical protein
MGVGRGAQPYPLKKKIVEKPPRNSAGFCGGGQGLSWAVEPRKEGYTIVPVSGFCECGDEPSGSIKQDIF